MELKMDSAKIEHLKGLTVISLTKCLIEKLNLSHTAAYKKLLTLEIYKILMNEDSGLFLESDVYLKDALDIEYTQGTEALIKYLSKE